MNKYTVFYRPLWHRELKPNLRATRKPNKMSIVAKSNFEARKIFENKISNEVTKYYVTLIQRELFLNEE